MDRYFIVGDHIRIPDPRYHYSSGRLTECVVLETPEDPERDQCFSCLVVLDDDGCVHKLRSVKESTTITMLEHCSDEQLLTHISPLIRKLVTINV